jgi:hypothetical protein
LSDEAAKATHEYTRFKVIELILYQFIDREQEVALRELLHQYQIAVLTEGGLRASCPAGRQTAVRFQSKVVSLKM